MQTTPEEKALFYRFYEDRWDYSYDVLDRGLTLGDFIKTKRPEYGFMFDTPKPKHFSLIPKEIQEEYKEYLIELLSDMWDKETAEAYSEDDAIRDFADNYSETEQ